MWEIIADAASDVVTRNRRLQDWVSVWVVRHPKVSCSFFLVLSIASAVFAIVSWQSWLLVGFWLVLAIGLFGLFLYIWPE